MAEGWVWTKIQTDRCPYCGLDPAAFPATELSHHVRREGARWLGVALRAERSDPDVWSSLEYACHTRDVIRVFADRIERTLVEDRPDLGWWDHEAAVVDEAYAQQDPDAVLAALAANASHLADVLDGVPADGWDRAAVRRSREEFTVAGMARFTLHEAYHHRVDALSRAA